MGNIVKQHAKKALLTWLLAAAMLLSMLSLGVSAADSESTVTYGFELGSYASTDTYKAETCTSVNSDDSHTYTVYFLCDSDEDWIDDEVTFTVTNVTPNAYTEMYQAFDVECSIRDWSVASAADSIYLVYNFNVIPPFTDGAVLDSGARATAGKMITIHADPGVRAVKVCAYDKNGTLLDYVYVGSNGRYIGTSYTDYSYSALELELYQQMKECVEAELWTDSMTNYEKLKAIATYISTTTHYPYTDATSEEYNPTFWSNWAVDGTDTLYAMFDDVYLNWIMDFQGGITTCLAAQILYEIAINDLNMEDVSSDSTTEGVYLASGSYSSNPSNYYHVSLIYVDENGDHTFIDAQGIGYSGSNAKPACEDHGCLDKLITVSGHVVTPHTHSYTAEVTTPATRYTEGVRTYTCSCGTSYTETIPVTGATFLFNDVQNSGVYYYDAVYWAYDYGITTGTSDTLFSPSADCTRAQFVTFLYRLAGSPTPTTTSCKFTDISSSGYYYKAVLWAAANGVTEGTTSTTFSPNVKITRAQAVTMIYRYAGSPSVSTTNPFTDTSSSAYYYDAMLWAVKNEITSGTTKTTFSPSTTCSRAMMVTFLYRYANL